MPPAVAEAIRAGIGATPARPARWPWLAATAAAFLVAALLPRMLAETSGGPLGGAENSLASTPAAPVFEDPVRLPATPASPVAPVPSVRDFPLADAGTRKPWPRSPLVPDERTMEAYLVRHNALMAEDGLGGFMPYVDVVANGGNANDTGNPPR